MRVVAIGGDYPVTFLVGLQKARGDCLLPDIYVEVAPDLTLPEAPLTRLFESPNEGHLTVQSYEALLAGRYGTTVFAGLRSPVLRVLIICRHYGPFPLRRTIRRQNTKTASLASILWTHVPRSYAFSNHSLTALNARALCESVFLPSPIS